MRQRRGFRAPTFFLFYLYIYIYTYIMYMYICIHIFLLFIKIEINWNSIIFLSYIMENMFVFPPENNYLFIYIILFILVIVN